MQILFILHYPPPIHGASVIGGLIKESGVINQAFDSRYINLSTSASIEEIGKNPAGKLVRFIRLVWAVKKELIFKRPDLCYLTVSSKGVGFYKDALISLLVRLFGVKRVYHFHNKGINTRQEHFFDNLLYRIVFKNANVILLSKHLYPDIQKYVPEERVHYCPNGIPDLKDKRQKSQDKSEEAGSTEQRARGNQKAVEILFISHLIKSKGVFVLLNALKILKERDLLFHCTMIGGEGDVSEKQMKQKIAEAELADNILLTGKKYGEEKQKALEMAEIFVHPSFNDCLPLVLLEAMQYSLPIVSTFEGAIPDVVEDGATGFLVPKRDVTSLAEKLEVLIKNQDLRIVMGAAGRKKYENEFPLEKFEERMVEILKEVGNT